MVGEWEGVKVAEGEVGQEGVDHMLIDLGLPLTLLPQKIIRFLLALSFHGLLLNLLSRVTLLATLLQFNSVLIFAFLRNKALFFRFGAVIIMVELHVIEDLADNAFQFLVELPLVPGPLGQYFLIDLESHLVYGFFELIADELELCMGGMLRCSAL